MLETGPNVLIPIVITNLIALALLFVSWKWSKAGRISYGIIFLGAAVFNGYLLFADPTIYINYGENVILESYENFIHGAFSKHLQLFLGIIVLGQLLIGLGFLLSGRALLFAALGAILFFIAIFPFGIGSAFPSTLIMALSVWIFTKKEWKKLDRKTFLQISSK